MATCARQRSSEAALAAALLALAAGGARAGQAPAPKQAWSMPRTPDGHPDLQGSWSNATITPLERPDSLLNLPGAYGIAFGKARKAGADASAKPEPVGAVLTAEQVKIVERTVAERNASLGEPSDPNRPAPPQGGDGSTGAAGNVGGYNSFWLDPGERVAVVNGELRSSLVVDPPSGKIPPLTPEAKQRLERAAASTGQGEYDHPELRPLSERCLLSFGSNAGPPMLPNYFYNNNYRIAQTKDHVMILVEMVHDVRVVRMGGEHLPAQVRPWMGDSIGRWEGDTLVVETTNFPAKQWFGAASENRRVIERFTRVDAGTILYRFTIEDPTTYTASWSGELPFRATTDQIYEYACHEGNYALANVLSGARAQEREAASGSGEKR